MAFKLHGFMKITILSSVAILLFAGCASAPKQPLPDPLVLQTNLFLEAVSASDVARATSALSAGADLYGTQQRNGVSWNALQIAMFAKDIPMTEMLIGAGFDVNLKDGYGRNALHNALDLELIKLVLAAGAEINNQDNDGESVLYKAVTKNEVEIVEHLIKAGADVNLVSTTGAAPCTALDIALESKKDPIKKAKSAKIVKILKRAKAKEYRQLKK
jgi:ankyrin repeat protein